MEDAQFKSSTVGDSIYYTLKRQIMYLVYKPGQTLSINDLAKMLQVSRSPVRDALIRLSNDGLVDIFPQKGTRVSLIDMKRVEEERFIRKSLEESALRIFITQYRKSDIALLNSAIEKQKEAVEDGDMPTFLVADNEFHGVFFEEIGKPRCWEVVLNLVSNHHRIRFLSYLDMDIAKNVILQHQEIVQHVLENNLDAVLETSHQHLSKVLNEATGFLKKYPDYFKHDVENSAVLTMPETARMAYR